MNDLFIPSNSPKRNYRHGHKPAGSTSPEYATWNAMRARCYNPQNPNYPRYGGRGITVCKRWRDSFIAFLTDVGRRPAWAHSLERHDNNGNYTPMNCHWATATEQANNRRTSRFIELNGDTRTMAEWSRHTGLSVGVIHFRLKSGWSVARALSQPVRGSGT